MEENEKLKEKYKRLKKQTFFNCYTLQCYAPSYTGLKTVKIVCFVDDFINSLHYWTVDQFKFFFSRHFPFG